jgi:type I restriction enzyme M protein
MCSKIFGNADFGYIKVTVERPLRLNFLVSDERIEKLKFESAFIELAESKKRKDKKKILEEEQEGTEQQKEIIDVLNKMKSDKLYKNRDAFVKVLDKNIKISGIKIDAKLKKALLNALSEKDPTADVCSDSKGNPEPDPELRDNENISLPENIPLPLPLDYDNKTGLEELVEMVKDHCEVYMKKEVLPHVPDAWIDYSKTKVGYEIPINRHFYVYKPPRKLEKIEEDIKNVEKDIIGMLTGVID